MNRFALLTFFVLAACSKSPEEKAKDPAAMKAEVAEATKFMAGQWDTTVEVTEASMPGMPPEMLKQMTSQKRTISHCMTKEEAEKSAEEMFKKQGDGTCSYQRFSMAGGKIDAMLTCSGGDKGGKSEIAMSGTYTADSYQTATEMKITNAQMPGGAMTMKAKSSGKRTGDCA